MANAVQIINAAVTRTGSAEPISSLDGSGSVETIANANYEILVTGLLGEYPWKFASKIEQLDRLDPDTEGEPPEPWTAAYQLPTDILELKTVKVAGERIDYAVHGTTILCDAGEDDEVIAHYVWRATEDLWPPLFTEGVIRRLEAIFLRAVGERYSEASDRDEAAERTLIKAKLSDSQSQTPIDPTTSSTLEARRA